MLVRLGFGLVAILTISSCGSNSSAMVSGSSEPTSPSPSLSADDQLLLTALDQLGFKLYETPLLIGNFVFAGAGLDYNHRVLQMEYGGLAIDEWGAPDLVPTNGACKDQDAFAEPCSFLVRSPAGRELYKSGPLDPGKVFVRVGETGFRIQAGGLRRLTLADLMIVVDALAPVTPEQVIALNQNAVAYAKHLRDSVAQLIDFTTYLPVKTIQDFVLDRKVVQNPADPRHPYLGLHYQRVGNGNQANEFWVAEFRDDKPLSAGYCGDASPELPGFFHSCTLLFTTPGGIALYSTFGDIRFEMGTTRIVVELDITIDKLSRDDVAPYVDSFIEVPALSLT
jgi:hypothetical protein